MPTIIFKATEKCNSNCLYCDVVARKAPHTMPLELLEIVFERINEYLLAEPKERITLTWHGGEPCLLGADYFRKALEFQGKHCEATQHRLCHQIQSNCTALNQELIDVFKQMGIASIGTSYEPLPNIRGCGEVPDSSTYARNFFKGTQLLKKNGLSWGFIYVITKKSLGRARDIFFHLSNLRLNGGFSLHPVLIYGEDTHALAITAAEYAAFLGDLFPLWWKHRQRYTQVDPFRSYAINIEGGCKCEGRLDCGESGRCAYTHTYIGPHGETSQCGRSGDWGLLSYGSIVDRSLQDIFSDEQRKLFVQRVDMLHTTECADCRFWAICHGGCPLDAYQKNGDFMHKSQWCDSKRIFIENYFEPITGLTACFDGRSSTC